MQTNNYLTRRPGKTFYIKTENPPSLANAVIINRCLLSAGPANFPKTFTPA